MHCAVKVVAADGQGQDRAAAISCGNGHLLLVADGAGGLSGGAAAAEAVLQSARRLIHQPRPADWAQWLEHLDQELQSIGETTAVVAFCAQGEICGASVGDSGIWLLDAMDCVDLTEHQRRKPLLGSGGALAVHFGPRTANGRLLLASDGLFKYVPHDRIQRLVRTLPIDAAAAALIEAARLPSGGLCDDIAVVIAE
jgi:serine/threonine protein phosphatase PrpC